MDPIIPKSVTTEEAKQGGASPVQTEKKILGMPVNAILLLVVGTILGGIANEFHDWYTAEKPHLTKNVNELLPFQGKESETAVLNLTVTSDGNKEVEDIDGMIKLEGCIFMDVEVGPAVLRPEKNYGGDTLNFRIKSLASGEKVQVSALVKKPLKSTNVPEVYVRSKTGVAENEKPREHNSYVGVLGGVFGMLGVTVLAALQIAKESAKSTKEFIDLGQKYIEFADRSSASLEKMGKDYNEVFALKDNTIALLESQVRSLESQVRSLETLFEVAQGKKEG